MASVLNEFLVTARWIVPIIPADIVLENHSLVISGDVIKDLLPSNEAKSLYPELHEIELPHHLVTAGFVNTHGHAAMTLLRGYADDLELLDWLNNHIWPVEGKLVDYQFVIDGTSLAVAEMLSTGTTCAADSYFFPDVVASVFSENKFRGQVCAPVIQHANAWAGSEHEHIQKGLAFSDSIRGNHLLTSAFAPHSTYSVTEKGFEQIRDHAAEREMPIHLHLHEIRDEVENAVAESGKRPIQRMLELGLMSPSLQTIHMTQLLPGEIEMLAENGVHVAHCPESNMKLASGFCPVHALQKSAVNVAIGTDGAASNNNLDMLEEIRTAALVSKVIADDATSINAHEALAMATINGAKLLGLDHKIGSLEAGKLADVIAVDLSNINFQPIHNPVSQLVYAASGHQVSHTWINGELLYDNYQFTLLDEIRLKAIVGEWQTRIGSIS